jgi:hypothetical protein
MPRTLVAKGSTQTIETYPKVRPSEAFQLLAASAATVKVTTPATPAPVAGAADIDTTTAVVTVAGVEGDTALTLGSGTLLTDTESPGAGGALADATALATVVLVAGVVYDVAVTFDITLNAANPFGWHKVGTLTARVTVGADGTVSIGAQTVTTTTDTGDLNTGPSTGSWTVQLRATGLGLIFSSSGLPVTGVGAVVPTSWSATVTLTATPATPAFVRGRRYLLQLTTGELLVVRAALTGATLRLASQLPCAVAASSTIAGLRISRALTAGETATEGRALVEWTATIGGQTYAWAEEIEIVRRVPRWELDAALLEERWPEVLALRENNDLALDETIDGALEQELIPELRAKGVREQDIITTWPLVPAHVAACKLFVAMNDRATTKAIRDELRADMVLALKRALGDVDAWFDAPQTTDPQLGQVPKDFSSLSYSR